MSRIQGWLVGAMVVAVVTGGPAVGIGQAAPTAETHCTVTSGRDLTRADPERTGLDSARLATALDFAAGRNRLDVQVFRHNCLIGERASEPRTGKTPWNIWSSTKSVISLLAGIASDEGKLDIAAPIDRYLPPGVGDTAHRAITVHDLLTESSGLRVGVINEGVSGVIPIDPDSAVQALGMPFDSPHGTRFSYSQRNVDLLSWVLELAVGEPIQQFAQQKLFDPLGIPRSDYYWARDRSGHTYGYAHLMIPPDDFAKLALLVSNTGRWGDIQVVSADYLRRAVAPSPTNHCYGFLFWTGNGCVEMSKFLPPDSFEMSGLAGQNVFVIPSLDLTVAWTGVFGNQTSQGLAGILQNGDELSYEFFRRLFAAFDRPPVPDPGPYVEPPTELNARSYLDPEISLALIGVGADAYPGCTVLSCLSTPLRPPFADAPPGCALLLCVGPDPRTPGIR